MRSQEHLDLINFAPFYEVITLETITRFMQRAKLFNFNISENSQNLLLEQQGFLLEAF
jgi:hypothetical protein